MCFYIKILFPKLYLMKKKLKTFQNNVVDYSFLYYMFSILSIIFLFLKTVYDFIKILDIFYSKVINYTYEARDVFIPYLFLHLFIYIILVVWWPLKETILLHPHWGCGTILITLNIKRDEKRKKKKSIFLF